MRRVVVSVTAKSDIEQGWLFYERRESGIGDYFESTIWTDIESLGHLHGIHGMHFGYYRMVATTFPFGIYYRESPEAIEVVAILDLRRNPSWLRQQLRKR